jgi:uncharacterized protein YndB with AHSA1/START domain
VHNVHIDLELDISPSRAFAAFTSEFGRWWPRDYSYSGVLMEDLVLGGEPGAACSEFGPEGFRIDFCRILEWAPPEQLSFSWQISPDSRPEPDPNKASRVTVCFLQIGDTTHIRLTHDQFERHGDGAEAYAEEMGSAEGWPHIMALFQAYASRS